MKILFPPGIGDIYWSLVKLESFLKAKGETAPPDIYIGTRPDEFNSHNRAWPFLERFPFIKPTGKILNVDKIAPPFWTRILTQKETGVFKDVLGCKYFIVYNGPINAGRSLLEVDPEFECNWNLNMLVSKEQRVATRKYQASYGQYIVYHFGTRGTYKYWTDEFSVDQIIESIKSITEKTKAAPILAGGIWDREDVGLQKIIEEAGCIDLLGKTSLEELYGLIQGAQMVTGFPSGLSMIAPSLGTKTLSLWSTLYPTNTWWNVVPPDTHLNSYWAIGTKGLSKTAFVDEVVRIANVQ